MWVWSGLGVPTWSSSGTEVALEIYTLLQSGKLGSREKSQIRPVLEKLRKSGRKMHKKSSLGMFCPRFWPVWCGSDGWDGSWMDSLHFGSKKAERDRCSVESWNGWGGKDLKAHFGQGHLCWTRLYISVTLRGAASSSDMPKSRSSRKLRMLQSTEISTFPLENQIRWH